MYYLFHDKVWMCFEGELPVKPEKKNYPYVLWSYDIDMKNYESAIATLKSKALPVQNYGEIYTIANDNLDREIKLPCIEVDGIGEVFEWSGTVEKQNKFVDLHGISVYDIESVYILHLPKPDYINKELKNVSKADLKKSLKEVNDKNERDRRQMQQDTNKALSDGFRCGPAKPYNGDDDIYYIDGPDEFVKGEPEKNYTHFDMLAAVARQTKHLYEENASLRKLIEKAFHEGYILEGSLNDYYEKTWEQFKKDNGL